MLYTYIPEEQIFSSSVEVQNIRAVYLGEEVSLVKNENGDYSINRLISTNPASFLKNEFAPGAVLTSGKIKLL